MKRLAVLFCLIGLASPAMAQGAVRSASATYYCTPSQCSYDAGSLAPPSGPTFNPTPPPVITTYTVGFTYDPAAGVLTYTQGTPDSTYPFDPNYCDVAGQAPDCTQKAAEWANLGQISLFHGTNTPGTDSAGVSFGAAQTVGVSPSAQADWDATGQEFVDPVVASALTHLSEDGVRGSLAPATTLSGNSITFTWSSSLLRNLSLTEIKTDTGDFFLNFDLHFAGYGAQPPKPKPIKVPTGLRIGPQVKPYVITTTGDSSGFYGGYTGHRIVSGNTGASQLNHARLGRLTWTSYNATGGNAWGVEWVKFGPGSTSQQALRIDGKISIHVYRPRNGVFTRMQVTEVYNRDGIGHGRQTGTFKLMPDRSLGGYWG